MSVDHQIHIANNCSESIYVLPVPNSDWVWADLAFDITTTVAISVATAGAGTAAASATVVNSLSTFDKVLKVLKAAAAFTKTPRLVASWMGRLKKVADITEEKFIHETLKTLQAAKDFLESEAIKINPSDYKQVFKEGVLLPTRYISPKGIGSAFGASDMTLFIVTESFSRMVKFNTNGDSSWIVNEREVVRAKSGKIWQESRGDGFYRFGTSNILFAPEYLLPGECLTSPNGLFNFVYQDDGNAVIYIKDIVLWESKTQGKTPGKAIIQEDGNFVIYDSENKSVWSTDSYGNSPDYENCTLQLGDDAALVVRKLDGSVLWSTPSHSMSEIIIQQAITNAVAVGKAVGNAVSDAASTVGNTVSDAASTVGNTVSDAASTVGNTVSDAASTVGNTVSDAASTVGNTVSDAASTVGNTVSDAASTVSDTVSDAASTVGNTVSDAASTVGNTVSDAASTVSDTVSDAAGAVTGAFSSIF